MVGHIAQDHSPGPYHGPPAYSDALYHGSSCSYMGSLSCGHSSGQYRTGGYMDKITYPAVVLHHRSCIDDAVPAHFGGRAHCGMGHDDGAFTDTGIRGDHSPGVYGGQEFYPKPFRNSFPGMIISYADNASGWDVKDSGRGGQHRNVQQTRRLWSIIIHRFYPEVFRPENVDHYFCVPAGSK